MEHNHRGSETSAWPCPACDEYGHNHGAWCQKCAEIEARVAALTAARPEMRGVFTVLGQLEQTLHVEQTRVAALTAALEKHDCSYRVWAYCGAHHVYHSPDIDAALDAAGGTP